MDQSPKHLCADMRTRPPGSVQKARGDTLYVCNPSTGEAEPGRSPELAGQPV